MTDPFRLGPGFTRDDASMNAVERDRAVLARRKAGDMRHIAAIAGTTEWAPLHPPVNLNDGRLPTAAFDWPIYRAALVAEVYGALWGQASPAEEAVLDVLARCAGLAVSQVPEVIPTCDLCGEQGEDGGEGEDWNGDTGNHHSCEASAQYQAEGR